MGERLRTNLSPVAVELNPVGSWRKILHPSAGNDLGGE